MIVTEYMENGSLDTFLKVRFKTNLITQSAIYILIMILKLKLSHIKAKFKIARTTWSQNHYTLKKLTLV